MSLRARLRAWRLPLQLAVTVILLVALWRLSGGQALLHRLGNADPLWIGAGLGFGTVAGVAAALRWRYTARRIGASLGVYEAIRELYLAMFLNQVLPGGISGDAVRAWRHGRRGADQERVGMGPAVRAVVIERVANQMVVAPCMLASMALWPLLPGALPAARVWAPLTGAAILVGVILAAVLVLSRRAGGGHIDRFLQDTRRALLGRRSTLVQLGLGLLIVGSCAGMFYCAVRAVHATLSPLHLAALVPGVLFSMSIPISIGGWGLREATAVALWTMAGLPHGDALAGSIVYGMLALLASLPGALALILDR